MKLQQDPILIANILCTRLALGQSPNSIGAFCILDPMNRNSLLSELATYKTHFIEEKLFISSFIELIESHENCYERNLLSGHLTGSAWVLNSNYSKALLIHHKKLNKWLQPGGHADGDENLRNVAQRELMEETGLKNTEVYIDTIFDLDIHLIPKNNQVPQHHHFDIRYLFLGDDMDTIRISNESIDVRWWDLDSISNLVNQDRSIMRLVDKSRNLSNILMDSGK